MTLQENRQREKDLPREQMAYGAPQTGVAEPNPRLDPLPHTASDVESVYEARDVEPTESSKVAREGEIVGQRRRFSPFMGFTALLVLVILIYAIYLLVS